jgi:hypothetical protein
LSALARLLLTSPLMTMVVSIGLPFAILATTFFGVEFHQFFEEFNQFDQGH